MNKLITGVNIAPSSESGHFIQDHKQIIELDNVNETFFVEGASKMITKNHTNLNIEDDCIITCQQVYNGFSKMYEKAID